LTLFLWRGVELLVPLSSRGPLRREDARAGDGMDVVPVLRTIRSVAPQHVEDGQRIEIARMQQLLAERG
jgi:hypothetical protein